MSKIVTSLRFIRAKLHSSYVILVMLLVFTPIFLLMATQNNLVIDDRTTNDFRAVAGNSWSLVTDGVMGGISQGKLSIGEIDDRACLYMQGEVSLDNNGGFIQIALNLPDSMLENVAEYEGILLEVFGNDEQYSVHLRTKDLTLPWQSYRASFMARRKWQTVYLPFAEFMPYRTETALDIRRLKRIGIVAIGRVFNADLCVGKVALYKN